MNNNTTDLQVPLGNMCEFQDQLFIETTRCYVRRFRHIYLLFVTILSFAGEKSDLRRRARQKKVRSASIKFQ